MPLPNHPVTRAPRAWLMPAAEFKALRKSTGLSQRVLCNTIGISRSTLQSYERGLQPAPKNVILLLRVLATKRESILSGKRQDILAYIDAPFDVSL